MKNYNIMYRDDGTKIGKTWKDNNTINMVFNPQEKREVQQSNNTALGTANIISPLGGYKAPMLNLKSTSYNDVMSYLVNRANAKRQLKYDDLYAKRMNLLDTLKNRRRTSSQDNETRRFVANLNAKVQQSLQDKRLSWDKEKLNKTQLFELAKVQRQKNQADIINKRVKTFIANPEAIVPNWGDLDEQQQQKALRIYSQYGAIPKVVREEKPFYRHDTFRIEDYAPQNPQQLGKQTQQGHNGVNQAMNGYNNTPKVLKQKVDPNGNVFVQLQDGNWYMK